MADLYRFIKTFALFGIGVSMLLFMVVTVEFIAERTTAPDPTLVLFFNMWIVAPVLVFVWAVVEFLMAVRSVESIHTVLHRFGTITGRG